MFNGIKSTCIDGNTLYVQYSLDEDSLLRNIYDVLSNDLEHDDLVIAVDVLDEKYLNILFRIIDAIKELGYKDISFELHLVEGIDDNLLDIINRLRVPIKVKYYISSSSDTFLYRLSNDVKIREDATLLNLSRLDNSEVVYEIIIGENDMLYNCVLLKYYLKKYKLRVRLIGDEEAVNYWIYEIRKGTQDIDIVNLKEEDSTSKVLSKKVV